jgi:hypothetical protein
LSDLTPDDNSAGDDWFGSGADYTLSIPEDGSGVLERLTLISEGGAATANYPLTLDGGYLDGSFSSYDINRVDNAFVAVNSACNVDGDAVPDDQDACPQLPGPPLNNGCPPPGPPAVGGSAGLIENSRTDTRWPGQYLVGITVVIGFASAVALGVRFRTRGRLE